MTLLTSWRNLDTVERVARCRSLAMGAKLLAGPKADALVIALTRAETDVTALALADTELGRLPTLRMRQLLCAFLGTLRRAAP